MSFGGKQAIREDFGPSTVPVAIRIHRRLGTLGSSDYCSHLVPSAYLVLRKAYWLFPLSSVNFSGASTPYHASSCFQQQE